MAVGAFVERNRAWIATHAQDNEDLYQNEVGDIVYVWLQKKSHPTEKMILLLTTENRHAWYGTPVEEAREPDGVMTRERQQFLRTEWEEYTNRTEVKREGISDKKIP